MQWTSITQFVDIETGEALTIDHITKKIYVKLKCTTKSKPNGKDKRIKIITWHCERNRQTEITFN